jgi:hypothetical protein
MRLKRGYPIYSRGLPVFTSHIFWEWVLLYNTVLYGQIQNQTFTLRWSEIVLGKIKVLHWLEIRPK